MRKLAFIGMGNMGRAIASGLVRSGALAAEDISAYAPHWDKLKAYCDETGIRPCRSAGEAVEGSDAVLLAVKPYVVEEVLGELGGTLAGKNVLSIALGWNCARLAEHLPSGARAQYIMPNTPALVGAGVLLFEEENTLDEAERADVMAKFAALGEVVELPARLMEIGGAISGCGPAFCAMFIEALADAGVKYGLPRPTAYRLASQMVAGTGKLQLVTGQHPGVIKDNVCSPGGTTIRGVEALERAGLRASLLDAIQSTVGGQGPRPHTAVLE